MKKLLLLSLTLMLLFSNLQTFGQTSAYHPFPDSNAVWNIHFSITCYWNGTMGNNFYSIAISEDTLINGQVYHKLTTPFVQYYSTGLCGGELPVGYRGAIRQDTTNRKVFYVPPSNTIELLLYDFTLQVGDTVTGYIESNINEPDIVQSIDSVLVGSTYRKRWNINPSYNIHFIEGIGSTYGLIQQSPGDITDFPDYEITCFQVNEQTLYPDTTTSCQLIVSVNTIESCSYQVLASPNPAREIVNFEFGNIQNLQQAQLRCYDVFGSLLHSEPIVQDQKEVVLDISSWPSGMYVAVVYRNGGVVGRSKFVVE